ncbi:MULTISPECIES: molybdenum cofactor guanylyltransferase [Asticcacaulis]|uniref:molybdenum cofactor guanylyltransferase n=1 Tax=Asticcacaulis TaxID=76890 RepID=UPI001AEA3824|nr:MULTISPECIES: molybdenum cofactor guanylyltransferase [Asticcacaulis]MBP2161700.1 molybdopterin-guanine dinucleotide biosynthesis protein A [Asticcacaulis solisilvae]MDR6802788.1 molybdopterin-guanine dinucleotide biosynthesis protein A [Asticcacaulis sp. BE141]
MTNTPPLVILAGGQGLRMGGNKPLHPYDGGTLIGAVIARLEPQVRDMAINAAEPGLSVFGLPLLYDEPALADLGPLSGIQTALKWARTRGDTYVITAPCDMPRLPENLVSRLMAVPQEGAEVVYFAGSRDYPLCARWSVAILPDLEDALRAAEGGLAVMRFLSGRRVVKLEAGDDGAFVNINAPES